MNTNTTRRDFLKYATGSAALLALPRWLQAAAPAAGPTGLAGRRPNIILILTDDQGYGDLGRHGNPVIQTPHLDRFYDESVRFTDFCVSPTCSPTRSSIMTGRHEFKSGVSHTAFGRERLSLKATTVAQVLKSAGYHTGIFGKWHLGDEDAYQPNRRGFDESLVHGAGAIGQNFGGCADVKGNKLFDPILRHNGQFVKSQGFCTDIFFSRAMKWINQVKGEQPFFLYLPTNAPHTPLACPPEYLQKYEGKVTDKNTAKFFGMITNIDDNVGRLLEFLKQQGIEKDTLVIFMNDNGGTLGVNTFNAGMKGEKVTAHYGGIRAMSFWHWPGTLLPGARNQLTAHLDILPTLAELAGAKVAPAVAARLDGFSLAPLLSEPAAPWHDDRIIVNHVGRWKQTPAKYGLDNGQVSLRWQNYLQLGTTSGQWELYDLQADIGETTDLAAKRPDIVARLNKAYDAWWAEVLPVVNSENANVKKGSYTNYDELYQQQMASHPPSLLER
jgi:arylsulfatase